MYHLKHTPECVKDTCCTTVHSSVGAFWNVASKQAIDCAELGGINTARADRALVAVS
jgi:hypothetical protein